MANGVRHLAVDFQYGAGRVGQFVGHGGVAHAHALQQLAHVVGAAARSGLVGHGADPLDQIGLEQAVQAHEQDRVGAVAADPVAPARRQPVADQALVDRVEDDDRVIFHAQRRSGVDPVPLPAALAQARKHGFGVVTALAGEDDVAARQRREVVGVLQRALVAGLLRRSPARVGGGEKHRIDVREVALGAHAVHQHRTDHAAPADQTYHFAHDKRPFS